jgi:hypothetical protein
VEALEEVVSESEEDEEDEDEEDEESLSLEDSVSFSNSSIF